MDRMITGNPHNRPGNPAIGTKEGMLFTDIRLHLGLSKRAKNPHVFRPDLFEQDAVPTKEVLESLANSQSMIRCKYVSDSILKDNRHVQFMPHYVDAVAQLTKASVILDNVSEQFFTSDEFHQSLAKNNRADRPELHVRVIWKEDESGFYCQSLGLRKVGLSELRTKHQTGDHEILVTGLMTRLVYQLFRQPTFERTFEFEEFGDTYVVRLEPTYVDGNQLVTIGKRSEQ